LSAALLLARSPLHAEDAINVGPGSPPSSRAEDVTLWQFGVREKQCLEWTDGCRVCRRTGMEAAECSNTGISCQPKDIHCTSPGVEK
jgi:hypothetical protein